MIHLVIGGANSGKSDYALEKLLSLPGPAIMIVTGKAGDFAFRRQILDHQRSRPNGLPVLEAGADLAGTLADVGENHRAVLVDAVDFWYYSCGPAQAREEMVARMLGVLRNWKNSELILVSSEVSLGPVPGDAQTMSFVRGLAGLNREMAKTADTVTLISAGLPLVLKGES